VVTICRSEEEMHKLFSQTNKSFVIQQLVPPIRCKPTAATHHRAAPEHAQEDGNLLHVRACVRVAVVVVGNVEVFLQHCPMVYTQVLKRDAGGNWEGEGEAGEARGGAWMMQSLHHLALQMEGVEDDSAAARLVVAWKVGMRKAVAQVFAAVGKSPGGRNGNKTGFLALPNCFELLCFSFAPGAACLRATRYPKP
jgi:hypothetical protein